MGSALFCFLSVCFLAERIVAAEVYGRIRYAVFGVRLQCVVCVLVKGAERGNGHVGQGRDRRRRRRVQRDIAA